MLNLGNKKTNKKTFTFDRCTPNMMQLYINTTFSQNNSFNKIPKCRTSGHSKNNNYLLSYIDSMGTVQTFVVFFYFHLRQKYICWLDICTIFYKVQKSGVYLKME